MFYLYYVTYLLGMAVRSCNSSGQWETPEVSNCTSYAYVVLMTLMEQVLMFIWHTKLIKNLADMCNCVREKLLKKYSQN